MKRRHVLALALIFAWVGAHAQSDAAHGFPASIAQLLASRQDARQVTLQGRIVSRVEEDELFRFSDGTAAILLKVDHKHWPHPVRVDPAASLLVSGDFDFESSGESKLKVFSIRPAR
jgi:uncharacterized protein (TIGR00156 family)